MQCNIERKGRKARAWGGAFCLCLGLYLLIISTDGLGFIVGGALTAASVFMFFEAWKGWCAIRAMGIKTPL